jgi:hypothetical protein
VQAKGEKEMERIEKDHEDFIWFGKSVHFVTGANKKRERDRED